MKPITAAALALATAFGSTSAMAQTKPAAATAQPAAPSVKPSSKALKAIVDLQTAVKANDVAAIPAKVAAANAVASTKEDRYLIGRLQLDAAIAAKDNAAMGTAIDAMAASGYLSPTDASSLYQSLAGTYYNAKQYPSAAAAYQKSLALNPNNAESQSMLIDSYIGAGQKAEAGAALQKLLAAQAAAGKKPDEATLKRAVALAYESKSPSAVELARQWVAAYPSPASWSDAIAIDQNLNRPDVEGMLALYRLLHATNAMKTGGSYAQYARIAAEQNNFNEAQMAYDAGVQSKLLDPTKPEYADLAKGLKAKQKATAADLAVATKTAQNGMALLRIGDRYYAMGDYAKAVELYKMAMGKPGVDTAVANLHIGMALARAGDKAGATTALNAVTGPRADIAKYWLTYVNLKA